MVTVGVLYVYVIGACVGWRWITVSCIAVIVIWSFLMLFVPETPTYLLGKKNYDGARDALQFLRGHPYVEEELAEIQDSVEESTRTKASAKDLTKPQNLKPLLISILLMFGQQFSGMNAIMFYGVKIFEAAHTQMNSFVENIIMGVVQVQNLQKCLSFLSNIYIYPCAFVYVPTIFICTLFTGCGNICWGFNSRSLWPTMLIDIFRCHHGLVHQRLGSLFLHTTLSGGSSRFQYPIYTTA